MDNLDYSVDQVLELLDKFHSLPDLPDKARVAVLPNPLWCIHMIELRAYRKVAEVFNTHANSVRQRMYKNVRNIEWYLEGADVEMFKLPPRLMHTLFRHGIITRARLQEVYDQRNGLDYLEGIGDLSKDVIESFLENG